MRASLLVFVLLVGCGGDDGFVPGGPCRDRQACEVQGDVCHADAGRCSCEVGSGLNWECEWAICPEGEEVEGTPCPAVGLDCGAGFEDPGSLCVGPEMVWATCRYYHQGDDSPPNGCPATPPVSGAPCCQGLAGGVGPTHGCLIGAEVWDCVDNHWVVAAPAQ
jgi:hypothetical protein